MMGNDKHSARMDDRMRSEVEGLLQGSPADGRAEEWRETQSPADGQPEPSAVPEPDDIARSDAGLYLTPDELEQRSRLGRFLHRADFPTDRSGLLATARAARAPDDVLDELGRLPADKTFTTVARMWAALGHKLDRRF